MSTGTLLLSLLGVIPLAVAGFWLARATGSHDLAVRIDDLHEQVTDWQADHRNRMVMLQRRMSAIERSVARAEDDARRAAQRMNDLGSNVLRRIEAIEQETEIELLVAQGRIAREHLRGPAVDW